MNVQIQIVLSAGKGLNGFTLDPSIGEFILTHPNIRCPERGNIYSINEVCVKIVLMQAELFCLKIFFPSLFRAMLPPGTPP
jgi:fructose-1,6-bisphosphatase